MYCLMTAKTLCSCGFPDSSYFATRTRPAAGNSSRIAGRFLLCGSTLNGIFCITLTSSSRILYCPRWLFYMSSVTPAVFSGKIAARGGFSLALAQPGNVPVSASPPESGEPCCRRQAQPNKRPVSAARFTGIYSYPAGCKGYLKRYSLPGRESC